MKVRKFEELEVWKLARHLTGEVYITDEQFADLSETSKKLSIMLSHFISYLKKSNYEGLKSK